MVTFSSTFDIFISYLIESLDIAEISNRDRACEGSN